ncbi:MAG: MarR family winged helix-turn-helix transcriptional regulator [Candidatus Saccharibacteria bacterium]
MPFAIRIWRARKRIKKDNQLMTQLYTNGPWDPIFLARDTNQTPAQLDSQVTRLISEGYVQKVPNQLHGRRTISLTAAGKNRVDYIRPRS